MQISERQLSQLSLTVKQLIQDGNWYLFTSPNNRYVLRTDDWYYLLDSKGNIVDVYHNIHLYPMVESVYFSDLPFPPSLSKLMEALYETTHDTTRDSAVYTGT